MKRTLRTIWLLMSFIATMATAMAQDVIIKRDGDEIQAKVVRVGATEIDYKKWSNQDGPTYSVNKSEVFIIKYANGEKDVFKDEPTATTANNTQDVEHTQPVGEMAKSSHENEAYINSINNVTLPPMPENVKKNNKEGKSLVAFLGVTSNSVMETDEIKVEIKRSESLYWNKNNLQEGIYLTLTNKTGSALYIDRALSASGANSYYNPEVITETTANGKNKSSGIGVNLGGVANALGVGGVVGGVASAINVQGGQGSHNGTMTTRTLSSERFSIVPAMSIFDLKREELAKETEMSFWSGYPKETGNHIKKSVDEVVVDLPMTNIGELNIYDEGNTPTKHRFVISYSSDPNFASYTTLVFDVYVIALYGLPDNFSKKLRQYFDENNNGGIYIKSGRTNEMYRRWIRQ